MTAAPSPPRSSTRRGVAVTPGLDFDPVRGGGTLRFSYARATADIAEGLERLKRVHGDTALRDAGLRAAAMLGTSRKMKPGAGA